MDLNEYQSQARRTAIYPESAGLFYTSLGLAGEAGELCNTVKKVIRDDDNHLSPAKVDRIKCECGGVLWYLANVCHEAGLTLAEVAEFNLGQLRSRQERGVLSGSGDDR